MNPNGSILNLLFYPFVFKHAANPVALDGFRTMVIIS